MASRWTGADVEAWMVAAYRANPYAPIYAVPTHAQPPPLEGTSPGTLVILNFARAALGERSDDWIALAVWARAKATGGAVGGSVAEFCMAKAWSRSTFELRRRRACERVAQAKNQRDGAG